MHELAITQSILTIALAAAPASQPRKPKKPGPLIRKYNQNFNKAIPAVPFGIFNGSRH